VLRNRQMMNYGIYGGHNEEVKDCALPAHQDTLSDLTFVNSSPALSGNLIK